MRRQSGLALFATFAVISLVAALGANAPKPSRTTFSMTARQITEGEKVTVKATVSAVSAPDGVPTGSVEFFDGATSLGTVTLAATDAGIEASLELTTLGVGPHPVTARYSGDAAFGGSVSQPEFVVVLARQ